MVDARNCRLLLKGVSLLNPVFSAEVDIKIHAVPGLIPKTGSNLAFALMTKFPCNYSDCRYSFRLMSEQRTE